MKNNYIESLLTEIQQLEAKIVKLKKNKNVSFSFFNESFKQTQEISRLLHELESIHIDDMKLQMEKLVQYLSESEKAKQLAEKKLTEAEKKLTEEEEKNKLLQTTSDEEKGAAASESIKDETDEKIEEQNVEKQKEQTEPAPAVEDEMITPKSEDKNVSQQMKQQITQPAKSLIDYQRETIVEHLGANNKSVNDIQPVNHTIQDVRRRISLNDKFLFQRELFHNNREAMNAMLNKLQSFSSYEVMEDYLKRNTHWNFKDETVEKFLQMLKDSFKK